jgi:predicted GIY-YIG superfamily endonuclease
MRFLRSSRIRDSVEMTIFCHSERSRGISCAYMQDKSYYVYIMMNKWDTVSYVGVTSDLHKRIYEHKNKLADGFTKRYNINKLVYFEETADVMSALETD